MKSIEIVKQNDLKDCGVASLLSIIIHYGGYVPIETLRIDCNITFEGTTAYDIIKTSKKYGFDSYGIRIDDICSDKINFPCIAHVMYKNGLEHYVVVYSIKKNRLEIMDPAKGKVYMKIDEFMDVWTNNIICFHPINFIPIISKPTNVINIIKKTILLEKNLLVKVLLVSLILTFVSLICSLYFQIGITSIKTIPSYFVFIILLFLFLTLMKLFLSFIRNKIQIRINKSIDSKLSANFINHLFSLPLNIFHNRSAGEIMSRVTELNNIKGLVMEIIIVLFLDSIMGMGALFILWYINKSLFFCLCFLLLLYFFIGLVYSKTIYNRILKNIDLESEYNSSIIHNIEMIDSIKNLQSTKKVIYDVQKKLSNYLDFSYTFENFINCYENSKLFVYEFGLFIINSFGFYLISNNSIDVLELVTFNNLLIYLFEPLKNIISLIPKFYYIKASIQKVSEFMSVMEENNTTNEEYVGGDIKIRNVSYSYNNLNKIIDNISLTIKEHNHVLLKGYSGSGKSTLCKLIARSIDNQQGNIMVGGVSIFDYNIETIRRNILYVGQKENLYPDTIKNNILFYRDCDTKKFRDICSICLLDKAVNKKAYRYESRIMENCANLSGGERQKIILARALLQNFEILIVDEALSEVDIEDESIIIKNLRKYYKDKTIIYVSHKNHDNLFEKVFSIS